MTVLISIILLLFGIGLWIYSQRSPEINNKLETIEKIASIVAVIAAIVVFAFPQLSVISVQSPTREEIIVYANLDWQNTRVSVNKGDLITVEYLEGLWTAGGSSGNIGAGGYGSTYDTILKGASYGGLLGKVGAGTPYFIGSGNTFVSSDAGTLYLRINDGILDDNVGNIRVSISVNK